MEISIDHLAKLSRLSCTQEEKKRLTRELARILAYADQLQNIMGDSVAEGAPITHALRPVESRSSSTGLRADTLPKKNKEEEAAMVASLRGAFPDKEEGWLRVPPVINKSSM